MEGYSDYLSVPVKKLPIIASSIEISGEEETHQNLNVQKLWDSSLTTYEISEPRTAPKYKTDSYGNWVECTWEGKGFQDVTGEYYAPTITVKREIDYYPSSQINRPSKPTRPETSKSTPFNLPTF